MPRFLVKLYAATPSTELFTLGVTVGVVGVVTGAVTGALSTVMESVAMKLPSAVVAVMPVIPTDTAVTRPVELTVATAVLPEDHVTDWFVALLGAMVARSWSVPPTARTLFDSFRETPFTDTGVGGALTVIVSVAVKLPSAVVAVIIACPALPAVTKPEELTDATAVLLEDQVTDWFVALLGATVARSWSVPPTVRVLLDSFSVTPVTETVVGALLTVMVSEAVRVPFVVSSAVAVIFADPAATAVTRPEEESTVATAGLSEDQVTAEFVAPFGATVAVSWSVPPTVRVLLDSLSETPVTATVSAKATAAPTELIMRVESTATVVARARDVAFILKM